MKNLLLLLGLGLSLSSCEKEPLITAEDDSITCGVFNGERNYTNSGNRYIDIKCKPKNDWYVQHQGDTRSLTLIDKSIYYNIKENTEVCFKHDEFGDNLGVVSYTESDEEFKDNYIGYTADLPCVNCYNY